MISVRKIDIYSFHQLKKDSQEETSQVKLSVLSFYETDNTQDHEEQEDRRQIINNRTEQLIHLISMVHSMYLGLKIFGAHKALFRSSAWKLMEKGSRSVTS